MTSSAVTSLAGVVTTDRHTSVAGSSALSSAVTDVTDLGSAQQDKVRSYYSLTLDQSVYPRDATLAQYCMARVCLCDSVFAVTSQRSTGKQVLTVR